MISDGDLDAQSLCSTVLPLLKDPVTLREMSKRAQSLYPRDAAQSLARATLSVIDTKGRTPQ